MSLIKMSVTIEQIVKSRKTVIDQFEEQGYDVSKYRNFSNHEVSIMDEHDELDMIFEHKVTKNKVYVCYFLNKQMPFYSRFKNIDEIIEEIFKDEDNNPFTKEDTLYIIKKEEPNSIMNDKLKDIWERDGIFVIVQPIKRLQYNILKLEKTVPYQRVITDEEKTELIKKVTDVSYLPEISRFDPVAKVLCLRPGMISVSERPSKTAIIEKYYRLCMNI
jgi:DNA-directed RNA polymerase subunit H (RpoH/RPB5)